MTCIHHEVTQSRKRHNAYFVLQCPCNVFSTSFSNVCALFYVGVRHPGIGEEHRQRVT